MRIESGICEILTKTNNIISRLPDHVANQIAAGEVIQRPASVVKELVENAVDAGGRRIEVIVKDAGRTLVQVIDDGKGMTEADALLCFERHATSKLRSADDLFALTTKGFRGEALASIAAIAQVELRTTAMEEVPEGLARNRIEQALSDDYPGEIKREVIMAMQRDANILAQEELDDHEAAQAAKYAYIAV